ncbi:MAG: hypothetical protein R3190_09605, partial [Thermoanaerobaculia bacterium]|nr:hypothetical protein [Thermoanaerobaculia bacterium]
MSQETTVPSAFGEGGIGTRGAELAISWILPAAVLLGLATIAATHRAPDAGPELATFALLSGCVTLCVAAVATRPLPLLGLTSAALITAALAVAASPARGATLHAILTAAFVFALLDRHAAATPGWSPAALVAASLGARLLARPELLFPDARSAATAVVIVLPSVVAAAGLAALLASRPSLLAAAVSLTAVASNGIDLRSSLLVALLGAVAALRRRGWRSLPLWLGAAAPVAALVALGPPFDVATMAILAVALVLLAAAPGRDLWQSGLTLWSGALLLLVLLARGYPWLRQAPVAAAVGRFEILPLAGLLLAVLILVLMVVSRRPAQVLVATAAAVAVAALPLPGRVVLDQALPLTAGNDQWRGPAAETTRAREVVLDSILTNSLEVAPEAVVATIRLQAGDGSWHDVAVRNGIDTGEWAARRADLRG